MRTILVLDPAASTGYSLVRIEGQVATIYDYGFLDVETDSEYNGDRCLDLMRQVHKLIVDNSVSHVAVEDYFFSKRFANGCDVNAAYRTAIHIQCRMLNIPYTILNISLWKKFVAGSSTPSKIQKAKWGKDPAKKLMVQEALWKKYGFRFPNHSLSSKTGKPIKFRYDIVDAVAQAVFFCKLHENIADVKLSVPVPSDVESVKTLFDYKE